MPLENHIDGGSIIERITRFLQPVIDFVVGRTHKSVETTLLAQQERVFKKGDVVNFFDSEGNGHTGRIGAVTDESIEIICGLADQQRIPKKTLENFTKSDERQRLTECLIELLHMVRTQRKWNPGQQRYAFGTIKPAVLNFFGEVEEYDVLFFGLINTLHALYPRDELDRGTTIEPGITSLKNLQMVNTDAVMQRRQEEPVIVLKRKIAAIEIGPGDDVLRLIREALDLIIEIYKKERMVH